MSSSGVLPASASWTTSMRSASVSGLKLAKSEPRQIGMRQLSTTHQHAAKLGAAMEDREHLAGIEQAVAVEGAFEPLLLVEIGLGEHFRHQVALLDSDTMLAGQDAAHLHAELQNVGAEFFRALELIRVVGVEQNERMQIAIAG